MSALYPEEPKKLDIITHLEELRRRILVSLAFFLFFAVLAFLKINEIMIFVKRPIDGLVDDLIFISPTEAFTSYLKVALLVGFIVSFPFILYHAWAFLSPAFQKNVKRRIVLWFLLALILFISGLGFSYFIAIPFALNFLISFGENVARAEIALGKYISFFGALILVGGVIFEIPIGIALLVDIGFVNTKSLRKKRHYALLAVMIFAAIITPTQDILNMLIFAFPMLLLYEVGIIIGRIVEKRK